MSDQVTGHCGSCGAALRADEAFCTGCGARQEPPAPQPAVSPSGERTLAVLGNLGLMSGFMGIKQKSFSLIITDRRLIFAELTMEKMKATVGAARDGAKADGKGFFGQWGAQLKSSMNYHQEYWEMTPDAALAENPGNFAIDRSQYQGAKFRTGVVDEETNTPDKLIIKSTSGKYKFVVNGSLGTVKKAFKETGLA